MKDWSRRDTIFLIVEIISILIVIFFGIRNTKLSAKQSVVNKSAKKIQRNPAYREIPLELRKEIELIRTATETTVKALGK